MMSFTLEELGTILYALEHGLDDYIFFDDEEAKDIKARIKEVRTANGYHDTPDDISDRGRVPETPLSRMISEIYAKAIVGQLNADLRVLRGFERRETDDL